MATLPARLRATIFLCALLSPLAAPRPARAQAQPRPPAKLVVPPQVKEQRDREEKLYAEPLSPLASPEVLAALGPFVPEVGAWVEYAVTAKGELPTRVRLAVLPPALPDGRYWLELDSVNEAGLAVASRVLAHGDPVGPRAIERMILYVAGQATLDLPVDEVRSEIDEELHAPPAPHAKVTAQGRAQLTVKGGSFKTDKLRVVAGKEVTTLYRAREVPCWGLVRAEGRNTLVELLGYSHSGAMSVIPAQPGDEPQGMGSDKTK